MHQNINKPNIGLLFRKMRKELILKLALSFILASLLCIGWLFAYVKIFDSIGPYYLIGVGLILAGWYAWCIKRLDSKVLCPSCSKSLIFKNSQGRKAWFLWFKSYPHCKISYEKNP